MEKKELFIDKAREIIATAKDREIILRLMGATAIWSLADGNKSSLLQKFGQRRELTDVDFMAYGDQWDGVLKCFVDLGYAYDQRHATLHGQTKMIFRSVTEKLLSHIDVIFDKLEYCHTIDFRKQHRLELAYPTITMADLLLEKMQIVRINEKDIIDTIILLATHDVGHDDSSTIDSGYVADLLSKDWGFYYTVKTNLSRTRDEFLEKYHQEGTVEIGDLKDVKHKITMILDEIEKSPKSLGWKTRAKVGPSRKWYRDVEEVVR